MAELAAGALWTTIEMAVEEQGSAQYLAGEDGSEAARAATDAEPAVAEQHGTRMMIETHGQAETLLKERAERETR